MMMMMMAVWYDCVKLDTEKYIYQHCKYHLATYSAVNNVTFLAIIIKQSVVFDILFIRRQTVHPMPIFIWHFMLLLLLFIVIYKIKGFSFVFLTTQCNSNQVSIALIFFAFACTSWLYILVGFCKIPLDYVWNTESLFTIYLGSSYL